MGIFTIQKKKFFNSGSICWQPVLRNILTLKKLKSLTCHCINLRYSIKASSRVIEARKYPLVFYPDVTWSCFRGLLQSLDTSLSFSEEVCTEGKEGLRDCSSASMVFPLENVYLKNFFFSWQSVCMPRKDSFKCYSSLRRSKGKHPTQAHF